MAGEKNPNAAAVNARLQLSAFRTPSPPTQQANAADPQPFSQDGNSTTSKARTSNDNPNSASSSQWTSPTPFVWSSPHQAPWTAPSKVSTVSFNSSSSQTNNIALNASSKAGTEGWRIVGGPSHKSSTNNCFNTTNDKTSSVNAVPSTATTAAMATTTTPSSDDFMRIGTRQRASSLIDSTFQTAFRAAASAAAFNPSEVSGSKSILQEDGTDSNFVSPAHKKALNVNKWQALGSWAGADWMDSSLPSRSTNTASLFPPGFVSDTDLLLGQSQNRTHRRLRSKSQTLEALAGNHSYISPDSSFSSAHSGTDTGIWDGHVGSGTISAAFSSSGHQHSIGLTPTHTSPQNRLNDVQATKSFLEGEMMLGPRRHSMGPDLLLDDQGNILTDDFTQLSLSDNQHIDDNRFRSFTDPSVNGKKTPTPMPQTQQPLQHHYHYHPFSLTSYKGPLYLVEFKSSRSEVFYIPEGTSFPPVKEGDFVIVEADRGEDLGKVVKMLTIEQVKDMMAAQVEESNDDDSPYSHLTNKEIIPKRMHRLAQAADLRMLAAKAQEEAIAMVRCQSRVRQKKLPMEVVDAEYQWDRNKLTFYFVADRRIDFRELVRDLFRIYKTRIWMCAVDKSRATTSLSSSSTPAPIPNLSIHHTSSFPQGRQWSDDDNLYGAGYARK